MRCEICDFSLGDKSYGDEYSKAKVSFVYGKFICSVCSTEIRDALLDFETEETDDDTEQDDLGGLGFLEVGSLVRDSGTLGWNERVLSEEDEDIPGTDTDTS